MFGQNSSSSDGQTGLSPVEHALARLPRVVDLLAARAEEHDRDATFPYQGIEAVHEAGLLTLTVAQKYGGPGASLADTVRVLAGLGRGDASVAVVSAFTLLQHAEQARTGSWPAASYRRVLTESRRRGPVLLAALPGPDGLPETVARPDGTGWRLTGRQTGCAGAEAVAWLLVRARTDEPTPRVGTFLVPGDSPGVEVDPVWDQLGLRASAGHDIVLRGVRVPAEGALKLTLADRAPEDTTGRAWHDLALSAIQLGLGRAAQDWLVHLLTRRTPDQLAYHRSALGEIETALIGAEELLAGLATRIDRGEPAAAARSGAAQLLVHRAVIAAIQQALTVSGGPGLSRRHPLERLLRDALSSRAYFPPDHTELDRIGGAALER